MADGKGNNKTFERWRQLVQATARLDPWRRRRMGGKGASILILMLGALLSPQFLCCQRLNRGSSSYLIQHAHCHSFRTIQVEIDIKPITKFRRCAYMMCSSFDNEAMEY